MSGELNDMVLMVFIANSFIGHVKHTLDILSFHNQIVRSKGRSGHGDLQFTSMLAFLHELNCIDDLLLREGKHAIKTCSTGH